MARWLFLLFFAANFQPSTSPSPLKSWAADDLINEKTAVPLAVLSLFSAVFCDQKRYSKIGRVAVSQLCERYHDGKRLSI